jgi:hypothetical protein
MVVCKGADSIINERLKHGQEFAEQTNQDLKKYA